MERNKDEVLTTDEAIQYLKISRPTYFKCIRFGRINAIKVGSGWRVLQSELNRFLNSGSRKKDKDQPQRDSKMPLHTFAAQRIP